MPDARPERPRRATATAPTEVAALRYEAGEDHAPKLLAHGRGIRRAEDHGARRAARPAGAARPHARRHPRRARRRRRDPARPLRRHRRGARLGLPGRHGSRASVGATSPPEAHEVAGTKNSWLPAQFHDPSSGVVEWMRRGLVRQSRSARLTYRTPRDSTSNDDGSRTAHGPVPAPVPAGRDHADARCASPLRTTCTLGYTIVRLRPLPLAT